MHFGQGTPLVDGLHVGHAQHGTFHSLFSAMTVMTSIATAVVLPAALTSMLRKKYRLYTRGPGRTNSISYNIYKQTGGLLPPIIEKSAIVRLGELTPVCPITAQLFFMSP